MSKPIVVGVGADGSGSAAVLAAARVASMMGTSVVVVFGYESSAMGPRGGSLTAEVATLGESAVGDAAAAIAAVYPELSVETELVPDRPVESLIRVAEARDAEVIVVGHGGRGPLRGALLGSITYEIVHRAPLPVLVIPDTENSA